MPIGLSSLIWPPPHPLLVAGRRGGNPSKPLSLHCKRRMRSSDRRTARQWESWKRSKFLGKRASRIQRSAWFRGTRNETPRQKVVCGHRGYFKQINKFHVKRNAIQTGLHFPCTPHTGSSSNDDHDDQRGRSNKSGESLRSLDNPCPNPTLCDRRIRTRQDDRSATNNRPWKT